MLKYRAWDKITKQMYSVGVIDFANKKTQIVVIDKNENCYAEYWRSFDEVIFMEDSGLFDKNGKGIFEGDIVQTPFVNSKAIIKFGAYSDILDEQEKDHYGFYLDYLDKNSKYIRGLNKWASYPSMVEIIGDIHNNPELLKKK